MSQDDFDPWRWRIACHDLRLAPLFDEPTNEPNVTARIAAAKKVCAVCPVIANCAEDARRNRDSGVRAGVLLENGRPVVRNIARGARPGVAA